MSKTKEYYDSRMNIPEFVDSVWDIIREVPCIDAPAVCLQLLIDEGPAVIYKYPLEELEGVDLARYCNEQSPQMWNKTCLAIDWLLENGRITFSDDGEMNCVA